MEVEVGWGCCTSESLRSYFRCLNLANLAKMERWLRREATVLPTTTFLSPSASFGHEEVQGPGDGGGGEGGVEEHLLHDAAPEHLQAAKAHRRGQGRRQHFTRLYTSTRFGGQSPNPGQHRLLVHGPDFGEVGQGVRHHLRWLAGSRCTPGAWWGRPFPWPAPAPHSPGPGRSPPAARSAAPNHSCRARGTAPPGGDRFPLPWPAPPTPPIPPCCHPTTTSAAPRLPPPSPPSA